MQKAPLIQFSLIALLAAPLLVSAASEKPGQPAFRDTSLPIEKRVDDLISRLTPEEKISQTMMGSAAIPRLDIPRYDWWNEALHGVARNGTATVFPQAIALASTWDISTIYSVADTISTEARAKNNEVLAENHGNTKRYQGLTIWSPNINIFRDPRWGRGQETYGEDPFLTGQIATAFIHGLQGNDSRYLKTVATVKHFAVHSGPEPDRHHFDAIASERDLWETYLPAFETGIREGGAQSLMSAYNRINGVPGPANTFLLQDVLRNKWGFSGAVVGDVDNVSDMWRDGGHGYSKDAAEASATAIKAGNDLCSGKTYAALSDALQRGLVSEADIDTALRHLFTLRFRLGQFDPAEQVPYRSIPPSANNTLHNDQQALLAARKSLVLLKNDGTLPFDPKSLKTVAVLGPTGSEISALLGNYSGTPSRTVTLSEGIRNKLEPMGIKVLTEPGVPLVKGFRVSGQPFPDGVLFTDSSRSHPGLTAEVFSHKRQDAKKPLVDGELVTTRTDTQIDLQWDEAQPVEGIPISDTGIRWTGVMIPPVSGEYVLGVVAESAAHLYVDDQPVIDSWRRDPERPLSTTIRLEKDHAYQIRLEYVQLTPKGRVQFGWIMPGSDDSFDRAMQAAREADHIILTLGITPDLEGESMRVTAEGFSGGDRLTLDLPKTQQRLLAAVAKLHKPTAVVLTTGSAINLDDSQAGAVLLAWYYGQRGADAVAEALIGETNPAGRLPITFYRNCDDLPDFADYSMRNRTYRYYNGKPLYAFGHGLSYSTFEYSDLALSSNIVRPDDDKVFVSVTVKNTSDRDGEEVVQLYATAQHPPVSMPIRELVGFQRVPLRAGESKIVGINLPIKNLRRWDDVHHQYVVDADDWQISASSASDEPRISTVLTVSP